MTDPGTELVERAVWEGDRRRALVDQACARADREAAEAERAEAVRAADAADQAAFVAFRRQLSGEPQLSVSAILERARLAEDGPVRDPAAPWGSEANPALLLDGYLVVPGPPRAQRSEADKQLDRARQLSSDLARYRRDRSGRRREAVRAGMSPGAEVTCAGCLEVGASPEESWLIHQDPDQHPDLLAEMDPVEHSARSYSAWPSQSVPMIYR